MLSRVETTDRADRRLAATIRHVHRVLRCQHLLVTSADTLERTQRLLADTGRKHVQRRIACEELQHTRVAVGQWLTLFSPEAPTSDPSAPSVYASAAAVSASPARAWTDRRPEAEAS
jgi:hypothetical protein